MKLIKQEKALYTCIRELIIAARQTVSQGVDLVQVHTNFEIGRRIVQEEQKGKRRADYGKEVIKVLADRLVDEFGRGFSERNLASMRAFYLRYQERRPILQSLTAKFESLGRSHAKAGILQSPTAKSAITQPPTGQLTSATQTHLRPFTLSWTHYVFLLGIVLCKEKNEALVKITLPKRANIHAKEYQLYLPGKDELKQKLIEWIKECDG